MYNETVHAARDRYLAENSLTIDSYDDPKFPIYVWKWPIRIPNPGFLPSHDLHHVVTGYGTGWIGEAEISAYELRAGCPSFLIFVLCVGAILGALLVAPIRVCRAWRYARNTRTLYNSPIPYEELLRMQASVLRLHLGIPCDGWCKRDGR